MRYFAGLHPEAHPLPLENSPRSLAAQVLRSSFPNVPPAIFSTQLFSASSGPVRRSPTQIRSPRRPLETECRNKVHRHDLAFIHTLRFGTEIVPVIAFWHTFTCLPTPTVSRETETGCFGNPLRAGLGLLISLRRSPVLRMLRKRYAHIQQRATFPNESISMIGRKGHLWVQRQIKLQLFRPPTSGGFWGDDG